MRCKEKQTRIVAFLTAGTILWSMSALLQSGLPVTAQNVADSNLVTGDMTTIQAIEIAQPETTNSSSSLVGAPGGSMNSSTATNADETDYEEDVYASYDGYYSLNTAQQRIYNSLKKAAHRYYTGKSSVQTISYTDGSLDCFATISVSSSYTVTVDELAQTISMFRADNPIYFFVGDMLLYSVSSSDSSTIVGVYLSCADEFTDSSTCQTERATIESAIDTAVAEMEDCTTALEYATVAHDWIADKIEYAYDENNDPDDSLVSHSIVGVFDDAYNAAVCEGYAKAFQLLLNAVEVENKYVFGESGGEGHAWNMARMDDGYFYYFDVTWDDSTQTTTYFAAGETSFSKKHMAYTIDYTGWYYLYDLPDVPDAAYTAADYETYVEGDFVYQLYADYAVLTSYQGDEESVTIPDTVDGLPVTQIKGAFAGDANLQTVVIPDSVTSISYGEDCTGAFASCVSLKNVTLPTGLLRLEYGSFYACSALETITLPETLTRIGTRAFATCTSLGEILIYTEDCTFISASSLYDSTVIYGYSGSTAETYADTYDRTFVDLNAETTTASTVTTTTTATTTTTTEETTTTSATTSTTTSESTATSSTTTEETTTVTETTETITTAQETTFTEEITEETTTVQTTAEAQLISDVNRDGVCSLSDLVMLNLYLMDAVDVSVNLDVMDCYRDGTINTLDSVTLLRFLLRVVSELPVYPEG